MVKKSFLVSLLIVGCEDLFDMDKDQSNLTLDVWMELPYQDGYYLYDYPNQRPHSYTSVQYKSLPNQRVFWSSQDTFWVYHQGMWFGEPIINFSTYTRSDSTGKQMVYTYPSFVGDTLSVVGCISDMENELCKKLEFIVY